MSKYPGRIVTDLAPAGYSVFFDGTGDYLNVASNTALTFGTGDFTVEGWFYANALGGQPTILNNGSDAAGLVITLFSSKIYAYFVGAGNVFGSSGATIVTNTWYHFAWVRSGSTNTFYLNGAVYGATYSSAGNHASTGGVGIGYSVAGTAFAAWNGYIANVRMVKGTALYTAAFTPPTQLLNITNTSLLTCNSPAIIDQSNNAFAITVNGNSAVSTFTPFTAYVPYNPALGAATPGIWTLDEALQAAATRQWNMYDPSFNLTTLLLHGNGTNGAQNNTFLDSSSNNFTITRNGNTTQGSLSPFSQTGWSTYFDGSGDSFSVSTSTVLDLNGAIDFTIEAWVYLTGYGSTSDMSLNIANKFTGAGGLGYTYGIFGGGANQGKIQFYGAAGSVSIISTNVIPLNSWNHVAIVKSGTTYTHYLNGVANGSQTTATTLTASANALVIGDYGYSDDFLGYMSNLRITKNGAVYTSGFTPPTSPLTTSVSAGTVSLLTFQSNRFVDNSSNGFTLTPSGTPSVQAFSPFYPTVAYTPQTIGGSGYFDGSSDFLSAAYNSAFAFPGDFTIEFWVNWSAHGASAGFVTNMQSSGGAPAGWQVIFNGANDTVSFEVTGSYPFITSSSTLPRNAWTHVAVVRSGSSTNNVRMYFNGAQVAQGTNTSTLDSTNASLFMGCERTGGAFITGYMSGARIVKGQALATGAFTPPTSPVTTTAVGWTGANAASSITGTISLLANFTNAGVVDSTGDNVLETVGNAQISTTQSKFGGSSIAFDGTGDYLVFPANPLYAFGTGDFTVEAWVYPTSNAAVLNICGTRTSAGTVNGWNWGILTNGSSQMYSNSAIANTGASTVPLNTWTHLAFVRTGGTIYGYVNGVQRGSTANTENFTINTFWVGITGGTAEPFFGYIDELRITRFARYTGNFTPQTSQWQDQ